MGDLIMDQLVFNGAAAATGTLDTSAVTDLGAGRVRIAATGHGQKVGSYIYISGTTNYDGNHKILAVAANSFDIEAKFVAETPAGTESGVTGQKMDRPGWIAGIAAKLNAVGAAENMSIVLDSNRGSDFDFTVDSQMLNTDPNWVEMYSSKMYFEKGDIVKITFANTTSKTYAIRLLIEKQ